jgi:general secretion pathway protein A
MCLKTIKPAEFQMNKKFETKGAILIGFKQFLHEVYESEGKVLLIVDEAQRLNHELLEQIRILSNIELDDRKLINIFFVGQSEFNQILREERNAAVRKRIAVSYNLDPLDHRETEKYINHRLNVAGAAQNLFTPEAIRDIFYFSEGYPRLINIVCDHALLTGYSKELELIDDRVIAECRKDLQILSDSNKFQEEDYSFEENKEIYEFGEPPAKEQGSKRIWMYSSFALAFILIGYLIFNFGWRDSSKIETNESPPSLKNSLSEKESLKSEDALKGDLDNEKVSKNDQIRTATVHEKLDETSKKSAASATQDDDQTADLTSLDDASFLPQQKAIIQFGHDSLKLPDEAHEILDQIVKFSSSNKVSEIIIEGYTDSWGAYEYNKNLSKSRADVIKKYLVDKGIPATKIETFGMGPENPIASNETFEGRKLNRRIEISVKVE